MESNQGASPLKQGRQASRARRTRLRPRFKYSDCLAEAQEIRLLELIPASNLKADMHCKLWRYPLSQHPKYQALSYTWGDSSKSKQRITLNGEAFFVTTNLLKALRRLRWEYRLCFVWIDAICINQDNEEREAQVAMMREIFSSAESAVVWLEESSFDSDAAIDFLPTLTKVARVDKAELWLVRLKEEDFLRQLVSLASLFWRPWWSRTWVIQEVALAKKVIMFCGNRQIPWSDIYNFVTTWMNITFSSYRGTRYNSYSEPQFTFLQRVGLRFMGMAMHCSAEAMSHMTRVWRNHNDSAMLSNLLWSFKNAEASEPRDKIYGLLGLARRLDRDRIKVDYGLTVVDLYTSVFRSFLLEDNGLDSFRWMTGETTVTKAARGIGLPSWVPDFGPRAIFPISSFIDSPESENKRLFAASGPDRSRSRSRPLIEFESDYQILSVRGLIVDTVKYLSRLCPSLDDLGVKREPISPTLSEWSCLARRTWTAQYSHGLADAFWRTILADRQIEGYHFEDRAGRYPAKRLGIDHKFVLPRNIKDEDPLVHAIKSRGAQNGAAGRRFCVTVNKFFGLMPETTRKGDLVCVLLGGEVPFVLRKAKAMFMVLWMGGLSRLSQMQRTNRSRSYESLSQLAQRSRAGS